jgi:hypothetical protein
MEETLFRPIVERAVREELDRVLSNPITPEMVDGWMRAVKEHDVGMVVKALALHRLRGIRKKAEKGRPIRLTEKEERTLVEKAAEKIVVLFAEAYRHDPDAPPPYDPRLAAFGVTKERFEEVYRQCAAAAGVTPPTSP